MDEYNSGMDPDIRKFFKKIMNSFSIGIIWMLSVTTLGLFIGLARYDHGLRWYNVLFYVFFITSLAGLVYYLYRVWRR